MTAGTQLKSTVRESGQLEITLANVPMPEPEDEEVVIGVEATPINPSDLGLLFAGADVSQARNEQRDGATLLSAPIAPEQLARLGARSFSIGPLRRGNVPVQLHRSVKIRAQLHRSLYRGNACQGRSTSGKKRVHPLSVENGRLTSREIIRLSPPELYRRNAC